MAEEKPAFMEEEEEGMMEEAPEEEASDEPKIDVDVEIEESTDFASPSEALAAAIKEHGADPDKLIAWFDEFGYELKKKDGEMEMGMEDMMGGGEPPMVMDLVSMRNNAASKAMEGM
jgi:hypothetical protein